MSGACAFVRKKYSYLDVAPEPLAFRNEVLEDLLKLNFGRLVSLFSYFALGRNAQACFQPFCFLFRVLAFSYPHRRAQAFFQLPSSSAYTEARTYCPGYPRGRLSVVKHRQLARQIGAFGEFASESSMDLDNMIFSTGSTFIFGSWICEVGDDGKLQGRLLEDSDHHQDYPNSTITTDQLAGRFA